MNKVLLILAVLWSFSVSADEPWGNSSYYKINEMPAFVAQCLTDYPGQRISRDNQDLNYGQLNFGFVQTNPNESMSLALRCRDNGTSTQPATIALVEMAMIFNSNGITNYKWVDFTSYTETSFTGTYDQTLSSDDPSIAEDPEDVVSTNADGSRIVRRRYQEVYLIASLKDGQDEMSDTHLVGRFILNLTSTGQTVVNLDSFQGTVDPSVLAAAMGGNAKDYNSGFYMKKSADLSLSSCLIAAANSMQAQTCLSGLPPEIDAVTDSQSFVPVFDLDLAWKLSNLPVNDPSSFTSNRVDFSANRVDMVANLIGLSSDLISASTVSAWTDEARIAITK